MSAEIPSDGVAQATRYHDHIVLSSDDDGGGGGGGGGGGEVANAPNPPRIERMHNRQNGDRPLLQFVGFAMLPSSPGVLQASGYQRHQEIEDVINQVMRASANLERARQNQVRLPHIPKNAPVALKAERKSRCWDHAKPGQVDPDTTCVMCMEPRGRKKSPAWLSPCCSLFACDKCATEFARFPHQGVCEACTRHARSHGGARHVPVGGPPGPESCTCRYICPQKCNTVDGMRSMLVEMEAAAEAEAQAKAKAAAEKTHRRPRMKRSRGGGGGGDGVGPVRRRRRKRRRVMTL